MANFFRTAVLRCKNSSTAIHRSLPRFSGSIPGSPWHSTQLSLLRDFNHVFQNRNIAYSPRACASIEETGHQGFSYPGPRKLKEIVKLPLLNAHGAAQVKQIWTEFHETHKSAIADVLSTEEYQLLMQRSQRCPNFVLPVPRNAGFFTMLLQFQGNHCLMTYLEDYKKNPAGAVPYATLTLFDDFIAKKGLALLRGEVTNNMTRDEAKRLVHLVKQFYLGPRALYESVVAFNENGSKFDFQQVLRTAGIGS